jgi:hypothetical protein
MIEPTVLSLQVYPRDASSEQIIKDTVEANPRNNMRLMNTEPVSRLHEYLVKKWKLSELNYDLVLYCKQSKTPMNLDDFLSSFQDNNVSVRLPIEYQLVGVGDEVATASSTPIASPEPGCQVDSILQEIQHLANLQASTGDQVLTVTISPRKPVLDIPIPKEKENQGENSLPLAVHSEPLSSTLDSSPVMIPAPVNELQNLSSMYQSLIEDQARLYKSILESQTRLMADLQTQMMSQYMASHERTLDKIMRRHSIDDNEDVTPRVEAIKKQRKVNK